MRTALVCAMALGAGFAPQKSPPRPLEHYAAIEIWTQGEIVEIDEAAGVLRLIPADVSDASTRSTEVGGRVPHTIVVELRYAKGWMYFDDPDGGPQQRFVLREGRRQLRLGQFIEIGRSNDYRGGVESQSIGINNGPWSAGGTYMKFKGWILVRVNDFLSAAEPQRPQ